MSEAEIIHDAEIIGTELEPAQHGTLFRTDDPVQIIEQASAVADALARVLRDRQLTSSIQGKEHVRVEGWTLLGTMLGVFPVVEWTRQIEGGGWEARVEARTKEGAVVGAAEAQCSRAEKEWGPNPTRGKMRDDYALRSMAQTRATSKALRGPLGFVVTLAGYEATPAEEMPAESLTAGSPAEDDRMEEQLRERRTEGPKELAPPKSWAKLTEMVAAYDEGTHDVFFAFADAARRLLYPEAESTQKLAKADKDFLFQKCARAAVLLRDAFDPGEFPPPDVEAVRGVFAVVLDGQELALPDESGSAEKQADDE